MSETIHDTTTPHSTIHGTGHGPHDEHLPTVPVTPDDDTTDRETATNIDHDHEHNEHDAVTTGRES